MSSQGQKAPVRVKRSQSNLTSNPQQPSNPTLNPSISTSPQDPDSASTSTRPPIFQSDSTSSTSPNRGWLGLGSRSRSHSTSNQLQNVQQNHEILPTHSHSSNPQVDWVRNHMNQDDRLGVELQLAEDAYETERDERASIGPSTPSGRRSRNEYFTPEPSRSGRSSVVEMLAKDDRKARETKEKEKDSKRAELRGGSGIQRTVSTGLIDRSDSMPSTRNNESNIGNGSTTRGTASRVRAHSRATDGHLSRLGQVPEVQSSTSLPRPQSSLPTTSSPNDYFSQISENNEQVANQNGEGTSTNLTPNQISPGRALVVTPGGTRDEKSTGWFGNALKKTMSSTNVFTLSRKPSDQSISKGESSEEDRKIQRQREEAERREEEERHHAEEVVDYLDVVDPEVAALGHLSNIQNSIFMPNISNYFDRRPSHTLPSMAPANSVRKARERTSDEKEINSNGVVGSWGRNSRRSDRESEGSGEGEGIELSNRVTARRGSKPTLLSRVSSAVSFKTTNTQPQADGTNDQDQGQQADESDDEDGDEDRNLSKEERLKKRKQELENRKHIRHWQDLDDEERNELDEHVRALLTKKAKFRRGMKGFWAFVKTRELN